MRKTISKTIREKLVNYCKINNLPFKRMYRTAKIAYQNTPKNARAEFINNLV